MTKSNIILFMAFVAVRVNYDLFIPCLTVAVKHSSDAQLVMSRTKYVKSWLVWNGFDLNAQLFMC